MDDTQSLFVLSFQELVGAAEYLQAKSSKSSNPSEWLIKIESLRARLARRNFQPYPLQSFIKKVNNKTRQLIKVHPSDRLLAAAIHLHISRVLEPYWPECLHSYRPGRSTFSAAATLSQFLAQNNRFILQLDIADFFPSIDRDILSFKLKRYLSPEIIEIIMSLLKAPIKHNENLTTNPTGLPLGIPISPLLSNIYLIAFDLQMQNQFPNYLRYADDILFASDSKEKLIYVPEIVSEKLADLGLKINPQKIKMIEYKGEPIWYLGHCVSEKGVFQKIHPNRLHKIISGKKKKDNSNKPPISPPPAGDPSGRTQTLYLLEPGVYVSIENSIIQFKKHNEIIKEVPLHRVDRVLVLAGSSFSSGFISACITHNIPLIIFVGKGRAYGSLVSGGIPNPLRLRSQYDIHSNYEFRLRLAKDILFTKHRAMILRLKPYEKFQEQIKILEENSSRLDQAQSIPELGGIEGASTKLYWQVFAQRIKEPDFTFTKRSKRPPRDPINSLLSFTYSLIFAEMQTALLAHGLDPHPGILHELHKNHPALASDLIEPYRHWIADSFVLWLVNKCILKKDDFETQTNGAVYLKPEPRKIFLVAYEKFIARPFSGADSASPRKLIHCSARAMLKVVLGEKTRLFLPLTQKEIIEQNLELTDPSSQIPDDQIEDLTPQEIKDYLEKINSIQIKKENEK